MKPTQASNARKRGRPPTHEEVARQAYELYRQRGGQPGNEWNDWFQAEQILTQESAKAGV